MLKTTDVGYVHQLRNGDDMDCDGRGCGANASVRITIPYAAPAGYSYAFYCSDCYKDFKESQRQTA